MFRILFFILCSFCLSFPSLEASIHLDQASFVQDEAEATELEQTIFDEEDQPVLRTAWFQFYPYQYSDEHSTYPRVTGLDVEMARAISRLAGFRLEMQKRSWRHQLQALAAGEQDMALSAIRNPQREALFHFSEPIRSESTVLYVNNDLLDYLEAESVDELLQFFIENKLRIGIIDQYAYADEQLNAFINDPNSADYLSTVKSDSGNFRQLYHRKVQAILIDRVVGASILNENGWEDRISEYPLDLGSRPLHFIFSKKTVTADQVRRFNRALKDYRENGDYSRKIQQYLFPVMLNVTVNQEWYFIIFVVGIASYTLFALRIAYYGRYGLIGSLIIACALALGGGSIRDIIVGRYPIFVLKDPVYIYIVLITTIVAFALIRLHFHLSSASPADLRKQRIHQASSRATNFFFDYLFDIMDALGLAAFTVIGVIVALDSQSTPLLLWGPLLAIVTTSGGSILCDLLCNRVHNASMRGNFYPEVAGGWGFVLSAFFHWHADTANPEHILPAVVITIIGAFATRMAALRFKWRGLMFNPANEPTIHH